MSKKGNQNSNPEDKAPVETTQPPQDTEQQSMDETHPAQETTTDTSGGHVASEEQAPTEETTPVTSDESAEADVVEEHESEDVALAMSKNAPKGLSSIAYQLGEYIMAMSPGKGQTTDSLQKNQLKLRSVINSVLLLPDDKFADGMKLILAGVRKYRDGVFSELHIFRGFATLRVSRPERQKLETLISLLLATADSKSPKAVTKVVDMDVIMRYVTNNDQMQKLQSFYGE